MFCVFLVIFECFFNLFECFRYTFTNSHGNPATAAVSYIRRVSSHGPLPVSAQSLSHAGVDDELWELRSFLWLCHELPVTSRCPNPPRGWFGSRSWSLSSSHKGDDGSAAGLKHIRWRLLLGRLSSSPRRASDKCSKNNLELELISSVCWNLKLAVLFSPRYFLFSFSGGRSHGPARTGSRTL